MTSDPQNLGSYSPYPSWKYLGVIRSAGALKETMIHPFPARMAPELVPEFLRELRPASVVLDPMTGSGTSCVEARLLGHFAVGFDRDPLAVLLARCATRDADPLDVARKSEGVVERAQEFATRITPDAAYPRGADLETKQFINFWFDDENRIELTALAESIANVRPAGVRDLMFVALSRMIITKDSGVSLARDVSHSRPHRAYESAPLRALEHFPVAVNRVCKAIKFHRGTVLPAASVRLGDARRIRLPGGSVDAVVTSPPYLDGIDYLRGHKLSLVWMGYSIASIRGTRASNIGASVMSSPVGTNSDAMSTLCGDAGLTELSGRQLGIIRRYANDMVKVVGEVARVLKVGGRVALVVGEPNVHGVKLQTAAMLGLTGERFGLLQESERRRLLPDSRRYLPPPRSGNPGGDAGQGRSPMDKRMREEVILTFTLHSGSSPAPAYVWDV